MTPHKTTWFFTIALTLLLTGSLFAQGRPPRGGGGQPPIWGVPQGPPGRDGRPPDQGRRPGPGRDRPPQGGPPGFNLLSSEMRFDSKVVKGAPYSAQAISENTQVLGDGTRITRKSTASIYRDNEGRTRRELSLDSIGPLANSGDAQQLIFINDPVAGNHYVLYPQNRSGRKMKMPAKEPPPFADLLPMTEGKTEALGKQTIEGVEAEGTRSTITIPAGQIGNDRPIVIVSERWYSEALQAVVLSKHSDPRVGENVYRLQNINRKEPAKALFEVPADFQIEEDSRRPPHKDRRPDEF